MRADKPQRSVQLIGKSQLVLDESVVLLAGTTSSAPTARHVGRVGVPVKTLRPPRRQTRHEHPG
jgi:hypothetical protein